MKVKEAISLLKKFNPEADLDMILESKDGFVRFAPVRKILPDCENQTVYIEFDKGKIS